MLRATWDKNKFNRFPPALGGDYFGVALIIICILNPVTVITMISVRKFCRADIITEVVLNKDQERGPV